MYSSKRGRQSSGYQATTDDDRQSSGGRKSNPARPPEKGLKCPRCVSSNTKFCYYNNYSLKQPRYFCKACRRYWTNGGALRTVPFGGGGARKRKQIVEPSSKFIKNHDYYSTGIFNFFQGFNHPPVDFELGDFSLPALPIF